MDGEIRFPGILAFLGVVAMGFISLMQIRKKTDWCLCPISSFGKSYVGYLLENTVEFLVLDFGEHIAKEELKQVFLGWVVGTEPRLAPIQLQALPLLSVLSISRSVPPVLDSFH